MQFKSLDPFELTSEKSTFNNFFFLNTLQNSFLAVFQTLHFFFPKTTHFLN